MKKLLLVALLLTAAFAARAQDPQYSQFYANQVLLSPAFTGAAEGPRLAMNARSQWAAIPGAYNTFAVAFDSPFYIGPSRHGAGVVVQADQAGAGNLTKLDVLGSYSFRVLLNKYNAIRLGLNAGFQQSTIDFTRLRFPNQYDQLTGFDPNRPNAEIADESYLNFDVGAGILYYNQLFWFGYDARHLTTPEQRFTGGEASGEAQLPVRHAAYAGIRLPLSRRNNYAISPVAMFRFQNPFTQLDLGAYVDIDPMFFGLYFRAFEPDALIGMIGFQKGMFRFGYSYDYTVSSLTTSVSGGSHEISLVIEFDAIPRSAKSPSVNMSCPKF